MLKQLLYRINYIKNREKHSILRTFFDLRKSKRFVKYGSMILYAICQTDFQTICDLQLY